jgi:vancomycin resistance protein YoaR
MPERGHHPRGPEGGGVVAWPEEPDINDPMLYTPRESPRVLKAGDVPAAAPPDESGFVFDADETWSDPLEILHMEQAAKPRPRAGGGPDVENPYARRHAPARGAAALATADATVGSPVAFRGWPVVHASVIAVCMALLAFIGVMMMPQLAGYFWADLSNFAFINGEVLTYDRALVDNYKKYRDYLRQDMIYQGVFVDGVHVGGMTVAQADEALRQNQAATANAFSLTINIGNKSWVLDNSSIPATRYLDSVLQQAYAVGRQNTTAIIGTSMTPFRERVDTMLDSLQRYVYLKSNAAYDHAAVRAKLDEIAAYVTRVPVDSQILSFDPNVRAFTFSDEQAGVTIDTDALYQQVIAKLDQGVAGESITVPPTLITPAITKTDMMNNFKLVAAFTTETTGDKNRNNNISLACQAINGMVLMPGETFSFNQKTGERTLAKGYREAGAIAAGQLIEDVGGGICQVSSTLFNAVVRADLEITSRSPHAWPSTYVKIGEDATVNWPNLDFKFTNQKSTPVFILAYYKDRKCSAEVWGMSLGVGVTIDLESRTIRTIEPTSEVKYVNNPSLATGESKETVKARTGYVVDTYKVWFKDGVEAKRSLLYTTTYKAYQRTIEFN